MATDDWYRGADWDDQAQQLIRQKLARAREHKWFYLRVKASAISDKHPDEALALYQEYLDADVEGANEIHYSIALVHFTQGREDKVFEHLDLAMGTGGMGLGAMGAMENAFLSALLGREDRYERAIALFEPLDKAARQQLGRDFVRSFAGAYGSALILDHLGRHDEAREAALIALEWTQKTAGPLPGHPQIGLPPQLPDDWLARLHRIAQQ
ncbi:hypothetical protein [Aurantiacibacter rhizosphaerae]|uniref:Tetratricopeptide repeat protein n=1 Tax=Aurantiacibacter rhizosphaerae TaxID=2691582 RepID=A0A844XFS6_9SPHN|nr:hypothetical protein [Aurantiacibacter rhizosphaerae]MWV28444.1 hypothetical protein [Aurantiacibacter rhizosphaerae]